MAQNIIKKYGLLLVFLGGFLYGCEDEYKKLLETYEQLEQKNFAVWYNIGVLYRELGQEAKATCAFVRAQKQAGLFEFEKACRQICQMGNFQKVYGRGFYCNVYAVWLCFYQYVFVIFFLLFFFFYCRMIFYRKNRTPVYVLFVFLIFIYGLYSVKYDWILHPYVGIIDQQADCFAGPDTTFLVVGKVHSCHIYKVCKQQNGFSQIKVDGTMCWIGDNCVERV